MSRTCPSALKTHMALSTTTLAFVMKVTPAIGDPLCVTDHDRDIPYNGDLYRAEIGSVPSAFSTPSNLELSNLNIAGAFRVNGITRADLIGKKYDGAKVAVWRVNWANPADGAMEFGRGEFGDVKPGDDGYEVDVFGLEQAFLTAVGRTYKQTCDATLGDARCRIALAGYTESGVVASVASQHEIECTIANANGNDVTDDGWFAEGFITWTSGDNQGMHLEIRSSSESEGAFTLSFKEDAPFTIELNDTFSIVAGCRGRKTEDCIQKFDNALNFRGFDKLPGPDVLSYRPKVKLS